MRARASLERTALSPCRGTRIVNPKSPNQPEGGKNGTKRLHDPLPSPQSRDQIAGFRTETLERGVLTCRPKPRIAREARA